MTRFNRTGHHRTNQHGTIHWVRGHTVSRDDFTHDAAQIRNFANHRSAGAFLDKHGAGKFGSACLVIPNARCPVCQAHVFFYANKFGSRVFFDNLGPPWPKHPCTNKPNLKIDDNDFKNVRIEIRTNGLRQELFAAESIAINKRSRQYGQRGYDWNPIVIMNISRSGIKNIIEAEFIESLSHETLNFTCYSTDPLFNDGDILSVKGNEISFVHPISLSPIIFLKGGSVDEAILKAIDGSGAINNQTGAVSSNYVGQPKGETRLIKANPKTKKQLGSLVLPNGDLLASEFKHFHSAKTPFQILYPKIEPIIRQLDLKGIAGPASLSMRLNSEKIRTASGQKWTPRLAMFLLQLANMNGPQSLNGSQVAPQAEPAMKAGNSDLTKSQMANMLSSLGKVKLSKE